MKFNNLLSATLFAGLFTMVSCSQEELGGQPQNDGKNLLQITVTDDGVFGETQSRAIEEGYKTTFEAGDMIGVYGKKNGSIVVENHKFTYTEDGTWDANGKGIEFIEEDMEEMKFYAYYPYQADGAYFDPSVDLKGDPFAQTVSEWEIGTDLDVDYTKYDLMTSGATDITSTGALGVVNFKLKHRMSIAAIELPGKVYNFTNVDPVIDSYRISAVPGEFKLYQGKEKTIKPYYDKKNDLYRILVKPNEEYKVSGTYTLEKRMDFESNAVTGQEGKARRFKLKGSILIDHLLQTGDYYCADGTIIAKDENIADGTNIIGVVFYVGNPQPSVTHTEKYGPLKDILYNDYPDCNHGLVVALNNSIVDGFDKSKFGESKTVFFGTWLNEDNDWNGKLVGNGTKTSIPGFMGYNNTVLMEIAQTKEPIADKFNASACLQAWKYTDNYRNTVAVPNEATRWFLPSTTEFDEMHISLIDIINPQIDKAKGQMFVTDRHYWTSTERDGNAGYEWAYQMSKGNCEIVQRSLGRENYPGYFRMMLAF